MWLDEDEAIIFELLENDPVTVERFILTDNLEILDTDDDEALTQ